MGKKNMRVMLLLYWVGSCVCWSGVGKKNYEGNVIVMLGWVVCLLERGGQKKTCGQKKHKGKTKTKAY